MDETPQAKPPLNPAAQRALDEAAEHGIPENLPPQGQLRLAGSEARVLALLPLRGHHRLGRLVIGTDGLAAQSEQQQRAGHVSRASRAHAIPTAVVDGARGSGSWACGSSAMLGRWCSAAINP